MKYLSDRYVSVCNHKGFDICSLKVAIPANGDKMNYVIDSDIFRGQAFISIQEAIDAIEEQSEFRCFDCRHFSGCEYTSGGNQTPCTSFDK